MPVVQSILVYRGEDINLHFSMSPKKDITGYTISFTVANGYNNPIKLFQVTAIPTNAPMGRFDVIITKAQLNIDPGNYVYDLFRTDPGNNRILSVGEFVIAKDARNP